MVDDRRPARLPSLPDAAGRPPGEAAQRRARPSLAEDTTARPTATTGRRLSDEERRRWQAQRQARLAPPAATPPPVVPRFAVPRPAPASAPLIAGGRSAPRMPTRSAQANSRPMVVVGAVLLVGLTVLAFAGGRLFGGAGEAPPPSQVVAASGFPTPSDDADAWAAGVPAIPTAVIPEGERAPVVCIDAGHGGPDSGFSQFWDALGFELVEKNLTLEHAWDLEARLKQRGYTVVMTRRTDVAVNSSGADVNGDGKTAADDTPGSNQDLNRNLDEFQARIDICNAAGADLLISVHVNGFTNPNTRGYETWYTAEREFGEQNLEFALLAYNALKEQLAAIGYTIAPELERGANPDTAADVQTPNSAFRHFIITGPAAPGLIVPSAMPGAIMEALFVSNDIDAAVLASPSGRNAIVTAYEQAIVEYFAANPPQ